MSTHPGAPGEGPRRGRRGADQARPAFDPPDATLPGGRGGDRRGRPARRHRPAARPRDPRPHAARHERHRRVPRAAYLARGPHPRPRRARRGGRQGARPRRGRRRLPDEALLGGRAAGARPRPAAPGHGPLRAAPVVTAGDLTVDLARREVTLAGEPVALTPTEFDILALLARNAGCVVTQRSILETVWGSEWAEDRQTLRAHVSNLRRKIERRPGGPRHVLTEPGVGFRFADASDAPQEDDQSLPHADAQRGRRPALRGRDRGEDAPRVRGGRGGAAGARSGPRSARRRRARRRTRRRPPISEARASSLQMETH